MMKDFFETYALNMKLNRQKTAKATVALAVSSIVLAVIIDAILWSGILSIIPATIIVVVIAYKLPLLDWYWGRAPIDLPATTQAEPVETASPKVTKAVEDPEMAPAQPAPSNTEADQSPDITGDIYVQPVRKTPKGVVLVSASADKAVFTVKSVVRFWFWFLPIAFLAASFTIVPFIGSMVMATNRNIGPQMGIIFPVLLTLAAAIFAYVRTRPNVMFSVTPNLIQYGTTKYDRKHYSGMQTGYSVQSREGLKNDVFDIAAGNLTALRLTYGRWGEDLPYLVNGYHAAEIVNWMNEIIDGVGAPQRPRNDPYSGRKIELL